MLPSLHYYLNLENTLISRKFFSDLVSKNSYSYYEAIRLVDKRVTLTAPAKDWLILKTACPEIIDLINNQEIAVLPTLFSHMLPESFPELLRAQLFYSKEILKELFDNIVWSGIIPENNVYSGLIPKVNDFWDSLIFSVSHNNFNSITPGFKLLLNGNYNFPVTVISNPKSRWEYMRMFREWIPVSEVIKIMTESIKDVGFSLSTLSCLFDFERPWSNVVLLDNGGISHPRMDIWKKFHSEFGKHSVDLSILSRNKKKAQKDKVFIEKTDLSMWFCDKSAWLYDLQKEFSMKNINKGDYFELASLVVSSSMPPRVLVRFMNDDSFKSSCDDRTGTVDLVGDFSKVKELLFICKNIKMRRKVSHGVEFLSQGERLYLELLDAGLKNFCS